MACCMEDAVNKVDLEVVSDGRFYMVGRLYGMVGRLYHLRTHHSNPVQLCNVYLN